MDRSVLKTRKEWFETLEEPHRTQAISNTNRLKLRGRVISIEEALFGGFVWGDSPEKHEYWQDYLHSIINGKE